MPLDPLAESTATHAADLASPPDYDLVIRAERVLTERGWQPAAVAVSDGTIAAVGDVDAPWTAATTVELPTEQVLIPGVVDSHVHVNEPGRTEWEGFASATRAAAAGGVTTIIDMPLNSIPPTTTPEALELKRAAAAPQSVVDVGFWGGAIPENLGTLRELHDAGVFGFKAFLAPSGVDEFPNLSTDELFAALREIAAFDGLLIVHAEDPDQLDLASASLAEHAAEHAAGHGAGHGAADAAEHTPDGRAYAAFVDSRPEIVESTAIENVIRGLRALRADGIETGRAHILHLSSAAALPLIREAKAEGLPLTVETCPHYLTFDAQHIGDGATEFKCCPPIRDEANREALWAGLVDGTIDIVASDHSPSTRELKFAHDGDFSLAWGGISGLELSFRAVWTGARERGIPLESVLAWMSTGTAAFVGLPTKGLIRAGADADLVAFDPEATFSVDVDTLSHKNRVSAFDGAELRGAIAATWVGGELVEATVEGAAPAAAPTGRLLRR